MAPLAPHLSSLSLFSPSQSLPSERAPVGPAATSSICLLCPLSFFFSLSRAQRPPPPRHPGRRNTTTGRERERESTKARRRESRERGERGERERERDHEDGSSLFPPPRTPPAPAPFPRPPRAEDHFIFGGPSRGAAQMRRARAGGAGGAPENLRIFETRCGVPTERAGTPQPPPSGRW